MPNREAIRSCHSFEARESSNLGLDQNGSQLGSMDWETLNAVGTQGRTLDDATTRLRDTTITSASSLLRTYISSKQCWAHPARASRHRQFTAQ